MSAQTKAILWLLFAWMVLLVFGCSMVTTLHPLNPAPEPIDREKFEGTWISEGEVVCIRFEDDGLGHLAGLEWKDDGFHLIRGEMIVARGKKNNFLSVRFEEDGKWMERYYLIQYEFTDQGDLVLWMPDEEAFEAAVKEGKLQGTLESHQHSTDITLTDAPEKILAFLESPENRGLFNHKEALTLKKINGSL